MNKEQFETDFSKYIEQKINTRNKNAQLTARNDNLIDYLDKEITFLENCEMFVSMIYQDFARKLAINTEQSFKNGKQAQLMEDRSGRNHDNFFKH